MQPYVRQPEYLSTMADGTVKQVGPLTGTEVWTVPGRGNRPLGIQYREPRAIEEASRGAHCAFCERRYLETPPEKARVVHSGDGWKTLMGLPAGKLFDTTAEFRCIPNLFEILSFDYWRANYGFELPEPVAQRQRAYLASPEGLDHVLRVAEAKLRASGHSAGQVAAMSREQRLDAASGFFGGGHDVIVARRHFTDDAADDTELAGSGTLSPQEHEKFITFTIDSMRRSYENNRYARYVAVFQNWLKLAGASFDHLHKQLVAIDERGVQHEVALARLRQDPNLFNEVGPNYAGYHNLIIAENDHAVAFAGFGHRYPTLEIYSCSEFSNPWEQPAEEVRAMSDLIHAMHAATGAAVACNEEWHYRPIDVTLPMPWRVMLKWRVSTLAGFEGDTKIYLNTISPVMLRDRVVEKLLILREAGRLAPGLRIATETGCRPNPLRYSR
jgi:UTP--hexose-1-phosphate uridylyltransferase